MAAPFDYDKLVAAKSVVGSIKDWVNHDTLDPAAIVAEAEQYIYAHLRAREMEVATVLTAVQDQAWLPVPAGFQDPIYLRLDGDGEDLEYVHETLLGRVYNPDGTIDSGWPTKWALFEEKIQFDVPIAASAMPLTMQFLYYGTPASLAVDNKTNFLTDRLSTLLRRTCTAYGYEARNRADMMQATLKLVDDAIEDANRLADMSRRGQTLRR